VFLAGDVWAVFTPDLLAMGAIGFVFFAFARRATRKDLQ
jgi:ABC-2 type transport system permease protein